MSIVQYPFIDIAVHDRVRERFAAGEAVVLLSADLGTVLWSNGRGARLFGYETVYDFLDQGPPPRSLILRQIETTGRQLVKTGDVSTFVIRIPAGFQSLAVTARCETVDIGGTPATLFTAPIERGATSAARSAAGMLEGLDDPDTHMAVLDAQGDVVAASGDFESLGLTPATARMLITMAGSDPSRLVKRPVSTAEGYLPAAIGKLSDDPALHLLLVVEAIPAAMDPAPVPDPDNDMAAALTDDGDSSPAEATVSAADTVPPIEKTAQHQEIAVAETDDSEQQAAGQPEEAAADMPAIERETAVAGEQDPVDEDAASEGPEPSPVTDNGGPDRFIFQRDTRAMRFVWKIDAEGRFSELSDEFSATVGPHAAAINGMAFNDVAALLRLDPDGKIRELLGRRDTWSGKTIWWPVEGTSLVVPIDLAALPTYTRDRTFDGFRGFGIVRVGDATEDPHALGLTFGQDDVDTASPEEASHANEATIGDEQPTSPETSEDTDQVATVAPETAGEPPSSDGTADETDAGAPDGPPDDRPDAQPAADEKPALRIVENALPERSEKIVQLPERRLRGDRLSPVEQAAFREIARQLDSFVSHRQDDADDQGNQENQAEGPQEADAGQVPAPGNCAETIADSGAATGPSAPPDEEGEAHPPAERDLPSFGLPTRVRTGLTAEVIDQMPVALLVHNGDMLLHGNPEFLRLTGYPSIESLAEVGGLDALLQRQDLDGKDDKASGMVVVRADDEVIPVTARLQSVRFDQSTALMLALMPIAAGEAGESSAPQAEVIPLHGARAPDQAARLQVEVEELRAILETATDGVVIIGAEGSIRSMNRAASALFNYDNEETDGKPFVMLFAHESQKAIVDYLGGLSGHGVASVLNDGREVIGREASGGFIPLFMTIGKLTSSNGYCAVIRDITQWKRTEEELRSAKRSAETANAHKSEFLAHVSHEIRTPLNAIIGFADLMASERFGPVGHPRYVEYANDIVRSGRHVLDIVNDLLDISKIEAGEMELEFASVELNESVSEAVSLVQPQANSQRVIIRTALSHAVPPVVADLRSTKQIVLNILSNAIRFTPSGGQIVVSTAYEANGSVVLRVRDTGIGMTRAELELAMKPFRQVAGSTRNRGDGTGLGLPLTKAMVDANRASFSISSTPREGTLVEITFPPQRVLAN